MSDDEDRTYRILLVDDEPDVLEAMAMTLRRAKDFRCEVELAERGDAALEILEAADGGVDLVLADYRMPGMNGAELLARVREAAPDTVRALITGYADLDIAMEAMEKADVHYYIQKPWDNEDLRLTVREALEGPWREGAGDA